MADIDIEKKSSPIWPWLLLGALILAVLLLFVFDDSEDDTTEMADEPTVQVEDNNENGMENLIDENENIAAVATYIQYVNDDELDLGIDHNTIHTALTQLVDATQAMADEIDYNIDAEMQKVNEASDLVLKEPYDDEHANELSDAFMRLSEVLKSMQEAYYPGLSSEIAELNETASSLNPDELTLDQRETVKSFFNQSADILSSMN